jgi:hypothetical protein
MTYPRPNQFQPVGGLTGGAACAWWWPTSPERWPSYRNTHKGYFDSIDQDKLMVPVGERISDQRVLKLIRK